MTAYSSTQEDLNTTALSVMGDTDEVRFKEIILAIRYCFLPIIFIGTCTNILNVIVFSSRRMLGQSTANFLLVLAVADLGLLYFQVNI